MEKLTTKIKNWIPQIIFTSQSLKSIWVSVQSDRLERKGNIEEARKLRKEWIAKLPPEQTARLWRQEGSDLLYRKKNYQESLDAFESSMRAIEENPTHYGISDPLQIYYGATLCCIYLESKDKAAEYFKKLIPLYECISKNKKNRNSAEQYEEGISWIREQLKTNV